MYVTLPPGPPQIIYVAMLSYPGLFAPILQQEWYDLTSCKEKKKNFIFHISENICPWFISQIPHLLRKINLFSSFSFQAYNFENTKRAVYFVAGSTQSPVIHPGW
jgi:hypothetical protein